MTSKLLPGVRYHSVFLYRFLLFVATFPCYSPAAVRKARMTPPTTTRAATTRTSAWSSSISRPRPHVQDHVDRVHGTNFGGMTRGAHPPRLHPVQAPRALSPASLHDRIVCTFASGCRCTAPQVLPVRPRARRRQVRVIADRECLFDRFGIPPHPPPPPPPAQVPTPPTTDTTPPPFRTAQISRV